MDRGIFSPAVAMQVRDRERELKKGHQQTWTVISHLTERGWGNYRWNTGNRPISRFTHTHNNQVIDTTIVFFNNKWPSAGRPHLLSDHHALGLANEHLNVIREQYL